MAAVWFSYNGNGLTSHAGYGLGKTDPYNPLGLPPYTVRVQYRNYSGDSFQPIINYGTATRVSLIPNVWDITYESSDWTDFLRVPSHGSYSDTHIIAVLGANSTGVTNMSNLFYGQTLLGHVSEGGYPIPLFDTSAVTNMSHMFYSAAMVTIPSFDTHNVTDMSYMFGTSSLREIPLIDTSNVINMTGMFSQCYALNTDIPALDTSKVTDMSWMFNSCRNLPHAPSLNTSAVTTMERMLYGCTSITSVPRYNTSNVTNMREMLSGCGNLLTSPVFDTSNVTDMYHMYSECKKLKAVPLLNTSKVTNMNAMFYYCLQVERGALALYQQASSQQNPPAYHGMTFTSCGVLTTTGTAELAQIPRSWGGTMT